MKTFKIVLIFLAVAIVSHSCTEEFLDIKRDKSQVVPMSLADYQAMLDNLSVFHVTSFQLNTLGVDEYYVSDDVWQLLPSPIERNAYIWKKEVFDGMESDAWNNAYARILYANIVIEGIHSLRSKYFNEEFSHLVKGRALFERAYNFYQLVQTFAPQYDAQTASANLGIPIKLDANVTTQVKRATLDQTYKQIISDLTIAIPFLPLEEHIQFRPIRQAGYALMAKTHLHMGSYDKALNYADSCIDLSNGLLDYNLLDVSDRYPFAKFSPYNLGVRNPEVLFAAAIPGRTILATSRFCIDDELFSLYEDTDIRKSAFFLPTRETYVFKGSYNGNNNYFGGLSLDEIVLLKSECMVRLGNVAGALETLNYFLENRYVMGGFIPFSAKNADEVIEKIIEERRKQLLCRGVRWEDLRRFNKEEKFQKTISRKLQGKNHILEPNSLRYTWPIPENVIKMSGMQQNPR